MKQQNLEMFSPVVTSDIVEHKHELTAMNQAQVLDLVIPNKASVNFSLNVSVLMILCNQCGL